MPNSERMPGQKMRSMSKFTVVRRTASRFENLLQDYDDRSGKQQVGEIRSQVTGLIEALDNIVYDEKSAKKSIEHRLALAEAASLRLASAKLQSWFDRRRKSTRSDQSKPMGMAIDECECALRRFLIFTVGL